MAEHGSDISRMVVLQLGKELYGVDVAAVREVTPMQPVTRLPRTPAFIRGVTNLRGRVVPVIDLRHRLSLGQTEATPDSRIAVVELDSGQVGLMVDAVHEVVQVDPEAVEPPSSMLFGGDRPYVLGVAKLGERLIMILDLYRLLALVDRKVV